jgi:hypothetical protein
MSYKLVFNPFTSKFDYVLSDDYSFEQSITNSSNVITLLNDETTPGNEKYYGTDGGGNKGFFALPTMAKASTMGCTFDGVGTTIEAGLKSYIVCPYDAVIKGWYLMGDASGVLQVDVYKDTWANYPPTTSIAGSEIPLISGSNTGQDISLSSWNTTINSGDVLGFAVLTCSNINRATLVLQLEKN